MSSLMRAAGYRLTRLGQHVDEICLRIDSGQPAVPTRSTMWVSSSILDAANIKDLGKLSGSPTPVPPTTSSRGAAGCPQQHRIRSLLGLRALRR